MVTLTGVGLLETFGLLPILAEFEQLYFGAAQHYNALGPDRNITAGCWTMDDLPYCPLMYL